MKKLLRVKIGALLILAAGIHANAQNPNAVCNQTASVDITVSSTTPATTAIVTAAPGQVILVCSVQLTGESAGSPANLHLRFVSTAAAVDYPFNAALLTSSYAWEWNGALNTGRRPGSSFGINVGLAVAGTATLRGMISYRITP